MYVTRLVHLYRVRVGPAILAVLGLELAEERSSAPLAVPHDTASKERQDKDEPADGDANLGAQGDGAVVKPIWVGGGHGRRLSDVDDLGGKDGSLEANGEAVYWLLFAPGLESDDN